jgi:hypothetical protein
MLKLGSQEVAVRVLFTTVQALELGGQQNSPMILKLISHVVGMIWALFPFISHVKVSGGQLRQILSEEL